jgi:hypothetical protein
MEKELFVANQNDVNDCYAKKLICLLSTIDTEKLDADELNIVKLFNNEEFNFSKASVEFDLEPPIILTKSGINESWGVIRTAYTGWAEKN